MKKRFIFIVVILILVGFFLFLKQPTQTNPNFFENISIKGGEFYKAGVDYKFYEKVKNIKYNGKKAFLAIGYESGKVDVYDGKNATKHMSIQAGSYRSNILNFSQDGQYLSVSGDFDATTYVYDLEEKALSFTIPNTRGAELFTSDSRYMILPNSVGIELYDLEKKKELASYKIDSVTTFNLNDKGTLLAVGTTEKIELFSVYQPSFYERLIKDYIHPILAPISSINLDRLRDPIRFLWFTDDKLVVLFRSGKIDIFSTPNLEKVQSISLNLKFINDAVMSADKQYIVAVGTTSEGGIGRCEDFIAEQIDLNLGSSKKILNLRTNSANISKWSLSEVDDNELFFVENAGEKMLIRVGETDNIIYKSN